MACLQLQPPEPGAVPVAVAEAGQESRAESPCLSCSSGEATPSSPASGAPLLRSGRQSALLPPFPECFGSLPTFNPAAASAAEDELLFAAASPPAAVSKAADPGITEPLVVEPVASWHEAQTPAAPVSAERLVAAHAKMVAAPPAVFAEAIAAVTAPTIGAAVASADASPAAAAAGAAAETSMCRYMWVDKPPMSPGTTAPLPSCAPCCEDLEREIISRVWARQQEAKQASDGQGRGEEELPPLSPPPPAQQARLEELPPGGGGGGHVNCSWRSDGILQTDPQLFGYFSPLAGSPLEQSRITSSPAASARHELLDALATLEEQRTELLRELAACGESPHHEAHSGVLAPEEIPSLPLEAAALQQSQHLEESPKPSEMSSSRLAPATAAESSSLGSPSTPRDEAALPRRSEASSERRVLAKMSSSTSSRKKESQPQAAAKMRPLAISVADRTADRLYDDLLALTPRRGSASRPSTPRHSGAAHPALNSMSPYTPAVAPIRASARMGVKPRVSTLRTPRRTVSARAQQL
eukprot:TRINITY_DN26719_c0_g1_i1.p1 TRINITY_DN26719_c0_g1~~TRINITY_DN26719_c0_g1_i1.p1  ORF type:complete len:527 (+),score=139.28 TRINITY_DN26719_c0_g1_i1:197-1777(+)